MEIFRRRKNNLRKFSIVVPSRETDFPHVKNNLESYLNVEAEEVLLCVDDNISQNFQNQIFSLYDSIKKKNNEISPLEIIKVERREDFAFHQAWVRRKGFLKAKNDLILTGDTDLYINKNVTEAIKIVGKNEIGLASLQKFPLHSNLMGSFLTIWRLMYQMFLRATYYRVFIGLYALYRPYWLETENDGIKNLKNVQRKIKKAMKQAVAEAMKEEGEFLEKQIKKSARKFGLKDTGKLLKSVRAKASKDTVEIEIEDYGAILDAGYVTKTGKRVRKPFISSDSELKEKSVTKRVEKSLKKTIKRKLK